MPYCVHCGVELGPNAEFCPLCQTPVWHPAAARRTAPYFATRHTIVSPSAPRGLLAAILSSMLLSVILCCGLLNLVLKPQTAWSLYIIGAMIMLWLWFVLPLLAHLPIFLKLTVDVAAVGLYVYFISLSTGGTWFVHLAAPVFVLLCVLVFLLGFLLRDGRHTQLSRISLAMGAFGLMTVGTEYFADLYLHGVWDPGWSLVTAAMCIALIIPLQIIRRVPALREEVRRRFNL